MTTLQMFRTFQGSGAVDTDLLDRFIAERDEAAFAELLHRHGPVVYTFCRRLLDESRADDAFQATFLVLATRANRIRNAASIGSWLLGVTGRIARQMQRRERTRARYELRRGAERIPSELPEAADLGPILDEEFARLPDKLRAVALACLFEGKTHAHTASALGESERTVRRRLAEAKALLRDRLVRRGVTPALAAGAIAGFGTATAVPTRLVELTLASAFDFSGDGESISSASAVLAKGVAMNRWKTTVTAAAVALGLGLTALGVGFAEDAPKPVLETIPPAKLPLTPEATTSAKPAVAEPSIAFSVRGGDELVNRVIRKEAEHQARVFAEKWFGAPLPPQAEAWRIAVALDANKSSGASTFTYTGGAKPGLRSAETRLSGSFEELLRVQLPHEIAHGMLAAHFGRPLPRWVDEGMAALSESAEEQARHDRACRELLNAGRGIRLKALLPMTEYPKDVVTLCAQGHSLVRFLCARDAKKLMPFIESGLKDGWSPALKSHFGFDDAAALETAWMEWLQNPETVLKGLAAKPSARVKRDYVIEAPDILKINAVLHDKEKPESMRSLPMLPSSGEYLVRPDGTVSLGAYGSLPVNGLTVKQATEAIGAHLRKKLDGEAAELTVAVGVAASNSKSYFIITDFPDNGRRPTTGEQVVRVAMTGSETVLDAVASNPGLAGIPKKKIWIERRAPGGKDQILPVDWTALVERGETKTNYQILAGDRVYVRAAKE